MGDQGVLQLHRGDPFAAGFDDVLGTVGQRDVAHRVDPADVAGAQPPRGELRRVGVAVVGAGDPRSADLQFTNGHTVIRQHRTLIVDDAGRHPAHGPSLGGADLPHLVRRRTGHRPGQRCHRRGFGHPPQLPDLHAVTLLERLHQRHRHCRTPAGHQPQRRDVVPGFAFQVVHHIVPDGGHRTGDRRALGLNEVHQRLGVHEPVRKHDVGARHQGGIRESPGVRVEHRHDCESLVREAQSHPVTTADRHRVQVTRTVSVHHALRIAGGSTGVTHCRGRVLVDLGPVELVGLRGGDLVIAQHPLT